MYIFWGNRETGVCVIVGIKDGLIFMHPNFPERRQSSYSAQVSVWHHTGFLSLSPGNPKLWQRLQSLFQDREVHSDPQQVPKDWQIMSLKQSITVRSCRHSSSLLGQQPCTCRLTSLGLSFFICKMRTLNKISNFGSMSCIGKFKYVLSRD